MTSSYPSPIRVLAFDLGNVLIRVDHMRFCRRLAELAGLDPAQVYREVFEGPLEPIYDTGKLSSWEYYRRLASQFGLKIQYAKFGELWCDIFDPMEGMEAMVAHLAKTFPLLLLSNTNPLHFQYIRHRFGGILQYFRTFVLSYQVGSRKPEAGIYQALIREANCPAPEILFMDDKAPFVEAARAQGLTAWQFTSPAELKEVLRDHGLWRD